MASLSDTLEGARRAAAQGDWRHVHTACMSVLTADPGTAEAWALLGHLAFAHDNFTKALELFERAAALAPKAAYLAAAAKAETTLGRHDAAQKRIESAAQAAGKEPADAHTCDTIGVVYSRLGHHATAVPYFRKAFDLVPGNASYAYNLGSSLQFSGDFAAARKAYEKALELDTSQVKAWSSLVSLNRQTQEDNHRDTLEELFSQFAPVDETGQNALHLGHALAKTCEDLGEFDTSLEWLKHAKERMLKSAPYDRLETERLFGAAMQTAAPANTDGYDSEEPIFIVGMPRSGTTLVDRIISSHSAVTPAGELTHFSKAVKMLARTPSPEMMNAETLLAAKEVDSAKIGESYLESTRPLTGATPRFIDKMPLNFMYAGLIHRALPNARIICLQRDPLNTCLSNYRQLFRSGNTYYRYAYDMADTAHYFSQFSKLTAHWQAHLPADRFMTIQYEEVVEDLESEARRLIAFCGLDWEPACLDFHANAAPVATASSVQVRQPIYRTSLDRASRYGPALDPMRNALAQFNR